MVDRLTYSVAEAAEALGIGVTLARELVVADRLPAMRLGRRVLIPVTALEEFIDARTSLVGPDQPAPPPRPAGPTPAVPDGVRPLARGGGAAPIRRPRPATKNLLRPLEG